MPSTETAPIPNLRGLPANLSKSPIQQSRMAALIPALPRQTHADMPWRIGKVGQGSRSHLEALHLVVHVLVQALPSCHVGHVRVVGELGGIAHDLETWFARGIRAQCDASHHLGLELRSHQWRSKYSISSKARGVKDTSRRRNGKP